MIDNKLPSPKFPPPPMPSVPPPRGETMSESDYKELKRWRLALVWLSEQDQGAVFKNVHGVFCASVGECEEYRVEFGKTPLEAIEALRKKVGP